MEIRKIAPEYRKPYIREVMVNNLKEDAKFIATTGIAAGAVALTHYKKPVANVVEKAFTFLSKPKFVQNTVAGAKNVLETSLSARAFNGLKTTGTAGKLAAVLIPITILSMIASTAKAAYKNGKTTQKYIDKSNA